MVFGYMVGLATAIFASVVMRMGQPALLYLVPCTLWPFLLLAWSRGDIAELWDGIRTERPPSLELLCPGSGDSSGGEEGSSRGVGDVEGDASLQAGLGRESARQEVPEARTHPRDEEEDALKQEEDATGPDMGHEGGGECRQRLLGSDDRNTEP
jgi:hypothetical protein